MGLKSGKSSENLKTFKDIINNWNSSTCNCRVCQSWPESIFLKVLLTSPAHVNTLQLTYTYANFAFNEVVIRFRLVTTRSYFVTLPMLIKFYKQTNSKFGMRLKNVHRAWFRSDGWQGNYNKKFGILN